MTRIEMVYAESNRSRSGAGNGRFSGLLLATIVRPCRAARRSSRGQRPGDDRRQQDDHFSRGELSADRILIAKSVAFNDFGGFTGSYWHDLQGSARVGVVNQTYAVTGTARGFNGDNPSLSTQERFTVNVAC